MRRKYAVGCCVLLAIAFTGLSRTSSADEPKAAAESPKAAAKERPAKKQSGPRYRTGTRSRDGIGKFYFGREIAHVMGYQGIDWLERPERESEEHLTALVDSLKLAPGIVVADIGAGSGVISLMMAKKIGTNGTVLAVDIQEEMLSVLAKRLKQLNVTNVKDRKSVV